MHLKLTACGHPLIPSGLRGVSRESQMICEGIGRGILKGGMATINHQKPTEPSQPS